MDPIGVSLVALGLMFVMLATGIPVAFAVGIAGLGGYFMLAGIERGLSMASNAPWQHAFSFTLMALPLFIMMGFLLERAGIIEGLFRFMTDWVGHLPGSQGIATLLACGVFSAVCGSGTATTATMSSICYPQLERLKYNRSLSAGILAAGGSLGPVIPPSGGLILYGVLTEQSVAKLFAASAIPGLVVLFVMSAYVMIRATLNPSMAPKLPPAAWGTRIASFRHIFPFALLIVLVLGGIYLGWATPTEAAAVGVFGSLLLMLVYRRLNPGSVHESLKQTVLAAAFIMAIVVFAMMLGDLFKYAGLPHWLAGLIKMWDLPYWAVFVGIVVIYLILGMFIDSVSIIVITVPLFAPVLEILGFDLITYGVIVILLTEIGTMTPPFALHIFVVQGITKVPYQDCVRGVFPFIIIWSIVVFVLAIFPPLTKWLPGVLF